MCFPATIQFLCWMHWYTPFFIQYIIQYMILPPSSSWFLCWGSSVCQACQSKWVGAIPASHLQKVMAPRQDSSKISEGAKHSLRIKRQVCSPERNQTTVYLSTLCSCIKTCFEYISAAALIIYWVLGYTWNMYFSITLRSCCEPKIQPTDQTLSSAATKMEWIMAEDNCLLQSNSQHFLTKKAGFFVYQFCTPE